MKICAFNINNEMRSGIQFDHKNTAGLNVKFFWTPQPSEGFFKWTSPGWQKLPIERLPQTTRQKLMAFWQMRGQKQP